jgi:nucleoside-diphosphate-sugar epimerase
MSGRILVTGAGGFVGGALVKQLLDGGRSVRAASRRPLEWPAQVEASVGIELAHDADWRSALDGIDIVVHCASRVHVMREQSPDPSAAFRAVNVDGTLALARQAVQAGIRRFVFVSTIGVHGAETFGRPFRANDAPAPHSPYSCSKYEAEQRLQELAERAPVEFVVVRPPLVHGPRAPGNFGELVRILRRGLPLPLASIDNRRSLVGLRNLVDLLVVCIDHPRAAGQTLLVSDGEDVSTPELLRRIARVIGIRARLFPVPVTVLRRLAAVMGRTSIAQQVCGSLQVDAGPTRESLAWKPPYSLDAELVCAVHSTPART